MCIGFCFLIKRELLDRIGPLTEEVERIFFEDEDFCMRATEAGFQNVVAEASYVYHAEHKTVRKMPEREALFARNRDWLREKWGRRLRIAWQRQNPLILGSDDLRSFLQELVAWARKRTLLYVYSPGKDSVRDALFRSVDLTPHADIHWHAVPPLFSSWHSAMRILMRRKKRFDIIISKDPAWQRMMCSLQWWHGAVVVSEDPHAIEATWKKLRSLW
ncbi:MAG: hypothetical protein HYU33_04195 [Candidatus Omnitrophica bacterium]|nr:hypothetical protein [Candidatus Omnitrophota bacterium]